MKSNCDALDHSGALLFILSSKQALKDLATGISFRPVTLLTCLPSGSCATSCDDLASL